MAATLPSPDLTSLYRSAEYAIKLYERISLDNLVSAVNELRYAGHHLLVAEKSEDAAQREDATLRAAHHCERAAYDAKEATIVALLEDMADFYDERFTVGELDAALPSWRDVFGKCRAAKAVLERAGSVKHFVGNEADAAIADLLDARQTYLGASEAINSMREARLRRNAELQKCEEEEKAKERLAAERLRERRDDRRYILNVILAILGILLSACGLVGLLL